MNFDTIIIGSGFGGAVTACRLSAAGRNVLVLERGRRWHPEDYPRTPDDPWIFDVERPTSHNGWLDLRFLDNMWVAQGAGVGGGSLVYANVSIDADPDTFHSGWPRAITFETLEPYYARVARMLKPQTLPDNQLTPRFQLMRDGAERTAAGDRFRKVPLAVSFDPDGYFPDRRPASEKATKFFENDHGRTQGYCVHAGNCDIGCKANARNTLDLNYLASAEDNGAEIRPLSLVSHVVAEGRGYAVVYHDISTDGRVERVVRANRVVLAAGSLGSTEILLRSRDEFKTLPGISRYLGHGWSSNGDFLTPAFYSGHRVNPTIGPTITAAIDFLDGSDGGHRYFVEDGGFPDVLANAIRARSKRRFTPGARFLRRITSALGKDGLLADMMPWFGQSMDGADGRLYLGRTLRSPWHRSLCLDWNVQRSEDAINALVNAHQRLSDATGGTVVVPPTWSIMRHLVTPHPLGGCCMAAAPGAGVVDDAGVVYGYPGLYVADGSIVPRPLGLNPSKTIAALAERATDIMLAR